MTNKLLAPIEKLGAFILDITPAMGRITIYMYHSLLWFLRPPLRLKLFFEQMVFMGNKSLFIVFSFFLKTLNIIYLMLSSFKTLKGLSLFVFLALLLSLLFLFKFIGIKKSYLLLH